VNNIIQDINNFRNIGKQVKGEYLINLSYSFYDISKKDLHLKVESFDSDLPLNSLLRDYSLYSNIEFKQYNKNTIRLSGITRNYGEDDIIVKFGNVSVELAKEIKDNTNKFKLVVRKKIDTKMPFYNKIFFNKFRNELVNDPMYKNNPNKFQFLIPNGTGENNFNSWLLRYEDKDFIFN
jgi:hypothetical protein